MNVKKIDPNTPVGRIAIKFGGWQDFLKALALVDYPKSLASVYRWTLSKPQGGMGGLIPTHAIPFVRAAANKAGIAISASDWEPGFEDQSK